MKAVVKNVTLLVCNLMTSFLFHSGEISGSKFRSQKVYADSNIS